MFPDKPNFPIFVKKKTNLLFSKYVDLRCFLNNKSKYIKHILYMQITNRNMLMIVYHIEKFKKKKLNTKVNWLFLKFKIFRNSYLPFNECKWGFYTSKSINQYWRQDAKVERLFGFLWIKEHSRGRWGQRLVGPRCCQSTRVKYTLSECRDCVEHNMTL